MAEIDNNAAQTSLVDGSENGVAPHSDPVIPVAPPEKLTCDWLIEKKSGWQYGESGVLDAIFKQLNGDLPDEHRWAVEFGIGDSSKTELTCKSVFERYEWKALLIDADKDVCEKAKDLVPSRAKVVEGIVSIPPYKTIDEYMADAGCPTTPALMVIDVDSIDYFIMETMKARPYVLCVEHMDERWQRPAGLAAVPAFTDCGKPIANPMMDQNRLFKMQATYLAVEMLAEKLGYKPALKTRINGIYIRDDIWAKVAKPSDGAIRLNIGAGPYNDDPRYTAIDIKSGIDARKLPYEDNSVDEVYASHVLEHFSFRETADVLAEWARVLKPGGIMRISVPDSALVTKDIATIHENGSHEGLEAVFFGAIDDETGRHRALFTEPRLRERMNEAGIGFVTAFKPFMPNDCSHAPISLNLEGTKRWWPKVEEPAVTLVLSQPSIAYTGHELKLMELAQAMKFSVQWVGGAFWDRDITVGTGIAINQTNPDFLMYSDYDSIFEVDDVKKLLETINNDPTMAAIGSVQMSRHDDRPLVHQDAFDYSKPTTRVKFQHFGLTIIRREVFDELPQPWFWSIPGRKTDGTWDWDSWGRTDADITFWRHLAMMGFKVYQHNEVCIGHICQCIKYPRDKSRGVQYIPIQNYRRHGKPKDAKLNAACYLPAKPAETAPKEEVKP